MMNPARYAYGAGGANPYAAGNKYYGAGRSAPNVGPVADKQGYVERDAKARAKRNAMLRRLKAGQRGNYASSAYLTPPTR